MPSAHLPLRARRRASLVALAAGAGLLAVGACGDRTASAVVLLRTGGLAGYDDELVVGADGAVTGSTRTGAVSCTVPRAAAAVLASAPAPSAAPVVGADRMAVTVRRASGDVDLGEAQGSDPLSTTARALLDDVQQAETERTVCR